MKSDTSGRESHQSACRDRPDPRDCLQPPGRFVRGGIGTNIRRQVLDLSLRIGQLIRQQVQGFAGGSRKIGPVAGRNQTAHVMDTLPHDDAKLAKMSPYGVMLKACLRHDDLRLLANQEFTSLVGHQQGLCCLALHRDKAHRRAADSFANGFSVSFVGLPALDVTFDIAGLHQPDFVPQLHQFPRPVMRAGTGLHADQAPAGQALKELQHLIATELPAQDGGPFRVNAVQLENCLRQVDPDYANLFMDGSRHW